jgi:hypothetical protein
MPFSNAPARVISLIYKINILWPKFPLIILSDLKSKSKRYFRGLEVIRLEK